MKVVVFGGAGYIGSHACQALALRGYEPITYDNLVRGHRWAVRWGPLEEGDIADTERVREVLLRHRPAAVMHFAAYAYVGESVEKPLQYYLNNVSGTAALLAALTSVADIPVVFSSTCATYGIPDRVPILETDPQRPINPYGYSKLVVERMLSDLDRACGLKSACLRYFNAAGADPGGAIGEEHDPEPHLIPRVLMAARDATPFTVFGDDYETPDGTCIRDYVHVCDLANAHVLALEHLLSKRSSCVFNVSNSQGHSVHEVVATAELVTGRKIDLRTGDRRPGDPPVLIGSAEAAHRVLGWKPQRSELTLQIEDAWDWMNRKC